MDSYVSKPIQAMQLLDAIGHALPVPPGDPQMAAADRAVARRLVAADFHGRSSFATTPSHTTRSAPCGARGAR